MNMNDKLDEKLSAFMDDESHPEAITYLQQDEQARARWMRYHLIRDVLSGHTTSVPAPDFASRVSAAIADEPTVLAPAAQTIHRVQHAMKKVAGLAIAATVAAVAVLTVQTNELDSGVAPNLVAASTNPVTGIQTVNSTTSSQPLTSEVESKLSGYLVNHNEYSVTARMQGMLPYMRIVGVTAPEQIVIRAADESKADEAK